MSLQGVSLAKENYPILQQANPQAELRVDSTGVLHVIKSASSIFDRIFGSGAKPDVNGVKRAKINAQIWGHLIPDIRELRAKEKLSNADGRVIQSLIAEVEKLHGEIEKLQSNNPLYISRMHELFQTMDKLLQELACRFVNEVPSSEQIASEMQEARSDQILGEIQNLEKFLRKLFEEKSSSKIAGIETQKIIAEIQKLRESVNRSKPFERSGALAKSEEKDEEFSLTGSISMGFGLGSSFLVGFSRGAVSLALFPFRSLEKIADLVSPSLLSSCLGMNNFSKALEEINKVRVWIPTAREDKKEGIAYTEALFEFDIEKREIIEEPRGKELRAEDGWRDESLPDKTRMDRVWEFVFGSNEEWFRQPRIIAERKKRSLEGRVWKSNSRWNRYSAAGGQIAIGSAKLFACVTTVALIGVYAMGRYGHSHNSCTGDCNLNDPTLFDSFGEYVKERWKSRGNWEKCDEVLKEKPIKSEQLQKHFQDDWVKNYCDRDPSPELVETSRVCSNLKAQLETNENELQLKFSKLEALNKCKNPGVEKFSDCILLEASHQKSMDELYSKHREDWNKNMCEPIAGIPLYDTDRCKKVKALYHKNVEKWDIIFEGKWEENSCDDVRPKTLFEILKADLQKYPKTPMQFSNSVDSYIKDAGDKMAILKEPANAVLLRLLRVGSYFKNHPQAAVSVGIFGAATAFLGNEWNKMAAATFLLGVLELSQSPVYNALSSMAAWDFEKDLAPSF